MVAYVCIFFQVVEVSAKCEMLGELVTRFQQLKSRLSSVTMEVEEVHKPHSITYYAALLLKNRIDVGIIEYCSFVYFLEIWLSKHEYI